MPPTVSVEAGAGAVADLFGDALPSAAPPPRKRKSAIAPDNIQKLYAPAPITAVEVPSNPKGHTVCLACPCGAREEILNSAPDVLNCWSCRAPGGMTRYVPRFPPPPGAGRVLTEKEMRNGRG